MRYNGQLKKRDVKLYFLVYSFLLLLLIIPSFLIPTNNAEAVISTNYEKISDCSTIELIAENKLVGVIQNTPNTKIVPPTLDEINVEEETQINGWYADPEFTTEYKFDYQPTANEKAYAKVETKTDNATLLGWIFSIAFITIISFVLFFQNKQKVKSPTNVYK